MAYFQVVWAGPEGGDCGHRHQTEEAAWKCRRLLSPQLGQNAPGGMVAQGSFWQVEEVEEED